MDNDTCLSQSKKYDLTSGSIVKTLTAFAMPYLFSSFMQAFYGAVDLYVVGCYADSSALSAVNIGSQIMHMITAVILGIAMGTTVFVGRSIGGKAEKRAAAAVGNTVLMFGAFVLVFTPLMIIFSRTVAVIVNTPPEAMEEAVSYIAICSAGIPFIVTYNVISAVLRGAGNSKAPMYFIAVACAVNITGDFLFTGYFGMGVTGVAAATVLAQLVSSAAGLIYTKKIGLPFKFSVKDIRPDKPALMSMLKVGMPVAVQDFLIQISFIVITVIANGRGVTSSAAVGIVEKIIIFMFLMPSAFTSAISAITAQNMGAKKPERAVSTVKYGILITMLFGGLMWGISQIFSTEIVSVFAREIEVIRLGAQYLRSYTIDCILCGLTFCLNGYLCGCGKSIVTFIHNTISIFLIRIPSVYILSRMFADSLFPMGLGAPMGSMASALILAGYLLLRGGKIINDNKVGAKELSR